MYGFFIELPKNPMMFNRLGKDIKKYKSFVGVHPCYPFTFIVFKDKGDAICCRNTIDYLGTSEIREDFTIW